MIRCVLLNEDGTLTHGDQALLEQWSPQSRQKCWVDIAEHDIETEKKLLLKLNCHPLAVQDALRARHPPKIEFFEQQTFLLYRGLYKVQEDLLLEHSQIALFASTDLLITRHSLPSYAVDHWWESKELAQQIRSPLLLAIKIVNHSFTRYLEAVLEFEQVLTENEDTMQEAPDDDLMRDLIQHKARLRRLLRTFNYHKKMTSELLAFLQNSDSSTYSHMVHDAQDLYERADRIASLLGMYYEICGDLIEGYISITSHKLNKTMQILTVVTTLFVPLSFLAGLYGMNFDYIPELKYPHAYFVLLGIMFTIAAGTLIIFRKKRWI